MAASASFVATPKTPVVVFANADGTTFKTIATGGTLGTRIDSISASNGDAATANVLQLAVQVSGVDYVLGEVPIPIGAGTNGTTKSVAVLNPADIPALQYSESGALWLASGATLRARVKTAVAGANLVHLIGVAVGDY
ncbi:hypothetical protein ACSFA2_03760 [Variovorax sp. LT2P21]|uniref:hypothetical protein n=1 Tax=Variovorax sp. LT2P21 TaxID=3443731 RepID=UPI003F47CD3D